VSHGNRIYVVGGYGLEGTARDEVYYATIDPNGHVDSDGWIGTTELPEARMYPGVAVYNDWVYVLGGSYTSAWMERDTVWFAQFNPDGTISSWAETTRLPYPSHSVAVVQWNGRLYILAGWNGFSQHDDVYFAEIEADGTIGSWIGTTSLPEARAHGYTAVVHDGAIYFIGGTTATNPATLHRNVYYAAIQPTGEVGAWTETAALPVGLEAHTSVVVGDDIFVIGGHRQPTYPGYAMTDKVLKAHINPDHTLGAWTECCTLPEPLCHHSSLVLGDRVYVIGGEHEGGGNFSDAVCFLLTAPALLCVDIDPNTLSLKSNGRWVTAYIELPEGYDVSDINVSTIMLNGTVPSELRPTAIGDYDSDGVPDLMVKFNRTAVSELVLSQSIKYGNVTLTMTGELYDGTTFEGSDVIRARMPGDADCNGRVDIKDVSRACKAYSSYPGHPRWDSAVDENEDGKIDIRDISSIAKNFGKTYL
jgi:N-acetylneuraminic acid mutarotase